MTRVSRIASNKPKLDMVLLCISSQFGLVKFGWELSGLVWFDIIWCGCRISDRISNADLRIYFLCVCCAIFAPSCRAAAALTVFGEHSGGGQGGQGQSNIQSVSSELPWR